MDDPAVEGLEELEIIREFVNTLRGGVECAVAYGSGAIRQEGYEKGKRSVVDLILGVTNAWAWHDANLKVNGSHYSLPARLMGGMGISKIQECSGGRIYYNVGVEHCGVKLKYGVVAMRRLVEDLLVWDNFYLAGRFHKPVGLWPCSTLHFYSDSQQLTFTRGQRISKAARLWRQRIATTDLAQSGRRC